MEHVGSPTVEQDTGMLLGRAGSVMRGRQAMVLSVGLLLLLTGVAVGASPAPGDEPTGPRFEHPELDTSVTFPPGWTVEPLYGETHGLAPDGLATCALHGSRMDEPVDDPDALLERVAEMYPVFPDDGPLPVIDIADLQLPAGRSIRLVMDAGPTTDASPDDGGRFSAVYLLVDAERMLFFGCWSEERQDDDWLAVAQTIEIAAFED